MPKVKLSALVSDIKGKANGSVFSTNNGGLYFRNNPSGGGKKSPKWDKQKSRLITISQAWKNLDESVQDAWNAAVSDFPTTNAFGATRIPTGYELYVRLNTVQLTYGNTLLVSPPSPRSAPSTGTIDVDYPELFQLNPQYLISCFNVLSPITATKLVSTNIIDGAILFANRVMSFRFQLPRKFNPMIDRSQNIVLIDANDGVDKSINFTLTNAGDEAAVFEFTITDGTNTALVTGPFNGANVYDVQHIIIESSTTDINDFNIYLNGVNITDYRDLTGTLAFGSITADLIIGAIVDDVNLFVNFSDIRIFAAPITADDAILIYNGYIFDTEAYLFPCTNLVDGIMINAGLEGDTYTLEIADYESNVRYLQPCSFGLVPLFSIITENAGSSGFAVNIYGTPPISNGRTGKMSNYKLLGSFTYETEQEFFVYDELRALFGNIAPNSQIAFYLQVYDTTTGVVSPVKQLATRKRPRFKAGSDLSTRVS